MAPLTLTKRGITITVDDTNVDAFGYFHDGNPWIATASSVNVTAHTPARTGTGANTRNGSELNPRGTNRKQGLDGRYGYGTGDPSSAGYNQFGQTFTADAGTDVCTCTGHTLQDGQVVTVSSQGTLPTGLSAATNYWVRDRTANTFKLAATRGGSAIDITGAGSGTHAVSMTPVYPLALVATDAFVVGRSSAGGQQQPRPTYFPLNGRSNVDEMMVLTVMAGEPTQSAFRPSAVGNPGSRFVFQMEDIQWSVIPGLFTGPSTSPPYSHLLGFTSDWWGEITDSWDTDQTTPNLQNPGYGQYKSAVLGQCLLKAREFDPAGTTALTYDLAGAPVTSQRGWLIIKLLQIAIDQWGAMKDGRVLFDAAGGHGQEFKAPVIFAGHALGHAGMMDPDTDLASASKFRVNGMFFSSGNPSHWGPKWKWRFGQATEHGNYQDTHPSTWAAATNQHNEPGFFELYRGGITTGTLYAHALAMLMLGVHDKWSKDAMGFLALIGEPVNALLLQEIQAQPRPDIRDGYHDSHESWGPVHAYRNYGRDVWRSQRYGPLCMRAPWIQALGYVHNQHLLICHDAATWSSNILLEVINAPAGVLSAELRVGVPLATPVNEQGALIWVQQVWTTGFSLPNAYGYIGHTQAIPAAPPGPTLQELQVTLQVVFTMAAGGKRATNALSFWLRS